MGSDPHYEILTEALEWVPYVSIGLKKFTQSLDIATRIHIITTCNYHG